MSHANHILPFGLGPGANVMNATLWAGSTARLEGFQAGIASSQQVNTALRQASFVAAMVAQFTADWGPADVNDDGDVTTFETEFVAALGAAIESLIPQGLLYEGTDTGTANSVVVSTVTPTLLAITTGKVLLITKSAAPNTGPVVANVLGTSAPVVWGDGSNLTAGSWPAFEVALVYFTGAVYQVLSFVGPSFIQSLGQGEGIAIGAGLVSLYIHGLTEEDILSDTDEFAFWQTVNEGGQASGHNRKITWAALIAAILARIPSGPNPPIPGVNSIRTYIFTSTATPGAHGYTLGMTSSGANLQAGTVPGVSPQYQFPMNTNGIPLGVGFGSDTTHPWFNGVGPFTGTWQLTMWELMPGWNGSAYEFVLTWNRV